MTRWGWFSPFLWPVPKHGFPVLENAAKRVETRQVFRATFREEGKPNALRQPVPLSCPLYSS